MKYKITANSVGAEITSIIEAQNEDMAWEEMIRLHGKDIYNGKVERYPLYDDQAKNLAAIRAEWDEAVAILKRIEFILDREDENSCPICCGISPTHYDDCDLKALLIRHD